MAARAQNGGATAIAQGSHPHPGNPCGGLGRRGQGTRPSRNCPMQRTLASCDGEAVSFRSYAGNTSDLKRAQLPHARARGGIQRYPGVAMRSISPSQMMPRPASAGDGLVGGLLLGLRGRGKCRLTGNNATSGRGRAEIRATCAPGDARTRCKCSSVYSMVRALEARC